MKSIATTHLILTLALAFVVPTTFGISSRVSKKVLGGKNMPIAAEQLPVLASDRPITLNKESTRVTLQAVDRNGQTLAARLQNLPHGHRLYLVLKDLSVKEQPGTLFRIYLDLPEEVKPEPNDLRFVGRFNFYSAGQSVGLRPPQTGGSFFFSFDITAVAQKLLAQRLLDDQTTLTILATGIPRSNSDPKIGRIEIIEQ